MSSISLEAAGNLARIREGIARAASRAGRCAEDITLVAVSKLHSAAQIRELYGAGVRHFGENRVQEWESKRTSLAELNATWHMIGHLQSNKAARAVRLFHAIDSVDSFALAERLDRAKKDFNTAGTEKRTEKGSEKAETVTGLGGETPPGGRLPILIEVKLDPGSTKSGVRSTELLGLVESVLRLPHLELRGLMGVPPYSVDSEKARPFFHRLREMQEILRTQMGSELLPVLSMGMSHDFEVAIEEGATEIRIGTALFGERPKA